MLRTCALLRVPDDPAVSVTGFSGFAVPFAVSTLTCQCFWICLCITGEHCLRVCESECHVTCVSACMCACVCVPVCVIVCERECVCV